MDVIMRPLTRIALIIGIAIMVAGCGYGKNPPSEFNVVTLQPLIQPPDYNLRPPGSGATHNAPLTGGELAKLIVLGQPKGAAKPDKAEQALLDKAAHGGIYGHGVREALNNERRGTVSQPVATVDKLVKETAPETPKEP